MNNTADIGRWGENVVAEWLRDRGYQIVERNWRPAGVRGEIDIIALKEGCLHFVEVKTRAEGGWASAEDAIDTSKLRALRRAASGYLSSAGCFRSYDFCFDLAAVDYRPDFTFQVRYVERIAESHW